MDRSGGGRSGRMDAGGMHAGGDAAAGSNDVSSRDAEVGPLVGVGHGFRCVCVCMCYCVLCITLGSVRLMCHRRYEFMSEWIGGLEFGHHRFRKCNTFSFLISIYLSR